ncbi:hypothetical protein ACIHFD_65325 [Nonomuraea sp. NPDC051941]|uniref:hypothetical protein n=1 Tax=Nonomuraea sp. NPDC051941 TaxID=3364373 RepID=UPI0037C517A4
MRAQLRALVSASLRHDRDVLHIETHIERDPGDALVVSLASGCQMVECRDEDGSPLAWRHEDDRLTLLGSHDVSRVRIAYAVPVGARAGLLPDQPWLARPAVGDFHVAITTAWATGGGGLVCGTDPHHGIPLVVAWPPDDEPRLHVEVRQGEVVAADRRAGREITRILQTLTGWLGPIDDVSIVDVAVPGAYAYSYPGVIAVHPGLLDFHATLFGQFLPHELSHQWFGNRVRFTGAGFLWPQECLPEALQALYVRERWGNAAYDLITRSYFRQDAAHRLQQLLSVGPAERAGLSLESYHDLLAVGTRWWLSAFHADARALHDIVRALAVEPAEFTGAQVVALVREAVDIDPAALP